MNDLAALRRGFSASDALLNHLVIGVYFVLGLGATMRTRMRTSEV